MSIFPAPRAYLEQANETVIPFQWESWDQYQGVLDEVVSAVQALIDKVSLTVGIGGRRRRG